MDLSEHRKSETQTKNDNTEEEQQIKFHQSLLQAQKKSASQLLDASGVQGLLTPKLFSAEQIQLMQAHQVQAQMQQVYQQVPQTAFYFLQLVFVLFFSLFSFVMLHLVTFVLCMVLHQLPPHEVQYPLTIWK